MKKLNDANIGILVLLSTCLCLFSCNNDNDNLPKDYAGFEHSKETVECEGNKSECELEIKIVAMEKAKEDRTVVLAVFLFGGEACVASFRQYKSFCRFLF